MFALVSLGLFVCTWLFFNQVGEQFIAKKNKGNAWNAWGFVVTGSLIIGFGYLTATRELDFEDGSPIGKFGMAKVLLFISGVGLFATFEGYGFSKMLVDLRARFRQGKE